MEILIDGRFKLEKLLGKGSFGALYSSHNIKTNELVAVKLEPLTTASPQLEYESKIYNNLKNGGKLVLISFDICFQLVLRQLYGSAFKTTTFVWL